MDISKGGNRAANGKVLPNQAQRRLLRQFVAEKQEKCQKAGIKPIRFKLQDFRKWTPELNKLGPPMRTCVRWKNCWFHHRRKRNFFEFYYEKVRENYQKDKEDVSEVKQPKKRVVSRKMQMRKFIEILKRKREESEARGEPVTIITTADFVKWTKILNKLGPAHPVDKWKMTWKTIKKQKKENLYFKPEDFGKYKEIGCGSSEEFYLSDDDSSEDVEALLTKEYSRNDKEEVQIKSNSVNRGKRRRKKMSGDEDCDAANPEEINQNFSKLCRICLKQSNKSMKTFVDGSYKNISYLDIYQECIGEPFKIYSFCSTDICDVCEKSLINMYVFRETCLQTDTKLSFIENQKEEELSDELADNSEEDSMNDAQESHEEVGSEEMDVLEEKSIPEDIDDSLHKKDKYLSIGNSANDQNDIFIQDKVIIPENSKLSTKDESENTFSPSLHSIPDRGIDQKRDSNSDCTIDSNSEHSIYVERCSDATDEDSNAEEPRIRNSSIENPITEDIKKVKKKERPNKAQIALLRKLVADKKSDNEKFGVRDFRLKKFDFKRWAPQLNALGPPVRPLLKWKDCWFIHNKKKNGFYDFMYRNSRKRYRVDNPSDELNTQSLGLDPTARKRMNKKQIEVFQKFLEDRRKKAEASGEEFQIFTKDFIALKPRLNELGPPFRSVNQWKLTYKHTKKNSLKAFAKNVHEIGYESSDAYYFTNESSDHSSDSEQPSMA
ncbi:uncharacterized protein LOC129807998 [Phlebotomus papatasi]|uniref:uncharacterized protein LOC129807998 n=1 Tax=Phlebotomus papatasi TaxID=29031 RepID=UPI0024836DD6|nr:uncharacterized protein LOC129807998 [Phlebotomus papatasi]